MSKFSSFFAENAIKTENIKYVASNRFIEDGNPIEWEISCVTSTEDEKLRKECTKRIPIAGNKGAFTAETDYDLYLGKLAARCTVYPDLEDKELQDSYRVFGADNLLKAMLTPGEYIEYIAKVQEVNGFSISFDDKVNEAKN